MKLTRGIALIVLFSQAPGATRADENINIWFSFADMGTSDEQTISRYRKSGMNISCDFVSLDAESILDLIRRVDSGDIELDASTLTVRLDGEFVTFRGTHSTIQRSGDTIRVAEWSGAQGLDNVYAAQFVVASDHRVTAYIDSPGGMYSLNPSRFSKDYFLCKRDPNFSRKID